MPTQQELISLIDILLQENDTETEWLEFKSNYVSPQDVGEYISALSNGAALKSRPFGYLIFGIDDVTHEVGNTTYDFQKEKVENENLENWLRRLLSPDIPFTVYTVEYATLHRVVLFEKKPFLHRVARKWPYSA